METKKLIDHLTAQGFNVFPDPNFIPSVIDESQLPALFVFGTGGYNSDDYLPFQYPTYQVLVKGKNYKLDYMQMEATEQLAKQVIDSLDNKINYLIGNYFVSFSKAVQSHPIPLGLDENDRPTFSTNFRFKLREV